MSSSSGCTCLDKSDLKGCPENFGVEVEQHRKRTVHFFQAHYRAYGEPVKFYQNWPSRFPSRCRDRRFDGQTYIDPDRIAKNEISLLAEQCH